MAWVRFPNGSRRKVERVDKADAKRDLDELLRASGRSRVGARASTGETRIVRRSDRGVVRGRLPERARRRRSRVTPG